MTDRDHSEDHENGEAGLQIITFENEEGETIDFVQLLTFELEDKTYAALTPVDELGSDEVELFVFHTGEDEGERFYTPIEDDDLAQRVFDTAVELLGGAEEE